MLIKIFVLLFTALTLSGCNIIQQIKPVSGLTDKNICIIKNDLVRPGFLEVYLSTLKANGYQVKLLPNASDISLCTVTSTYSARWSWDFALYMAYAKIQVYRRGRLAGSALYDSTSLYFSPGFSKFIKGDQKIAELVNHLFP